jgi:hypothetical protein
LILNIYFGIHVPTIININFHLLLHSYDFKDLRYFEHSQQLMIPRQEYPVLGGFAVFDLHLNSIKPSHRINYALFQEILSGFMPARSLVFDLTLTAFLSHSVISMDLETGKLLWTFNLESGACAPNFLRLKSQGGYIIRIGIAFSL